MVEFINPITKKEISYHIDKKLKSKWDKLKEGKLAKIDEDRCYIVDGRERSGKSLFTFQQAKYIDPTFDVNRICFTPEAFLEEIKTASKGSVVVFDEAFRGLSSKSSQSKINKMIVQAMMEVGQRNLIIFIVLPTFFLLEMYAAVLRSNALFHIYKEKTGKRAFRIYNYQKKALLYNVGKKKGFSYAFPKVISRGRFFNIWSIDEEEYRQKKGNSLREIDKELKTESNTRVDRAFKQRDLLLKQLYKEHKEINPKLTKKDFSKWLEGIGLELSNSSIKELIGKDGENDSTTG